jgi:hypothetical protein
MSADLKKGAKMNHKAASLTPEQALNQLELQYERSVNALRKAIGEYINHSVLPDDDARANGLFVYPQLSVSWDGADHKALKPGPGDASPMPVATPPPLPTLSCFAPICWSS